jgi:hypothetical protein
MQLDPRMRPYLGKKAQPLLPGILQPAKRVPPPALVSHEPPQMYSGVGATVAPASRNGCTTLLQPLHHPPATVAPYSKTLNSKVGRSTAVTRQYALQWAEVNGYAYRQFCQELRKISEATEGGNVDMRAAVLRTALRAGIPDHIALALEEMQ